MRKIELTLPDWVNPNRIIHIFAGMDYVAFQLPDKPMMVKTTPCGKCGSCCRTVECEHLIEREDGWICDLYDCGRIPFICAATRAKKENHPTCTAEWRPI